MSGPKNLNEIIDLVHIDALQTNNDGEESL